MTTTTLAIHGMHCQNCIQKITAALQRVAGVRSASVTLLPDRRGQAVIESDTAVDSTTLTQAVEAAGNYTVNVQAPTVEHNPSSRGSAQLPRVFDHAGAHGSHTGAESATKPSLYPLALIIAYILGVTSLIALSREGGKWHELMLDFMAGFFLVFSFFKLLDLRGFADAYQTYDIIARRARAYAFAYPFIELALGVAYLLRWQVDAVNAFTLALMLVGSIGVIQAVLSKRRIRCACLGTALNLPMTTVTIVEDLGMAAMAGLMLLLSA